jgi:signal transduction histidine kinase
VRAADLLDAPYGEIMVLDGDVLVTRAATSNQPFILGDRAAPHEALLSWQAVTTREPAILNDYSAWPHHRAVYHSIALHAVADFPIMQGDRCLGVLALGRDRPGYVFDQEQVQAGRLFAQLAALVLDNAQLYAAAQAELAERIQTAELLRQSNAELQLRNEELDAFAHTVAHDLKGPLSIIVGYADLLLDSYGDLPADTVKKSLRTLGEKGRKASSIIEALLLFAGVRQQAVLIEPLDTSRLIDGALQLLAEEIHDTGAVIYQPDRSMWPVARGYAPWVEEIWVNYLGNALKYGGRPPHIELNAALQPDGLIRFSVRDDGPGLTPEQRARLFVPFERLEQTEVNGHGLGLSIARRIADKLGGQVGVESEPGRGSIFYFTLPAADHQPEARQV